MCLAVLRDDPATPDRGRDTETLATDSGPRPHAGDQGAVDDAMCSEGGQWQRWWLVDEARHSSWMSGQRSGHCEISGHGRISGHGGVMVRDIVMDHGVVVGSDGMDGEHGCLDTVKRRHRRVPEKRSDKTRH
jgi:hypothetical protein